MPELPEVEVLVRHLRPALRGRIIRRVQVNRAKVLAPTSVRRLQSALTGARFKSLARRGKYLLFEFVAAGQTVTLLGHLGMTGRMFVADCRAPLPRHAAVVFELNRGVFVFEDTRYFGRLTLDLSSVARLGPEPLEAGFSPAYFARQLKRSRQAIKVRLLDQSLVAGIGNIYASEALYRACISPRRAANRLTFAQVTALHQAIREVLAEAIHCGSTLPLDLSGAKKSDGLFYFGSAPGASVFYTERLQVYDRAGKPCIRCEFPLRRIIQAARSTFFCARCQK